MSTTTLDLTTEKLESRRLLAGNVDVEFDDGDLEIRGERNTDQAIVIEQENGGFLIRGLDTGEGDTTINGAAQFIALGVTGDVDINLRSGRSTIGLNGGTEESSLRIFGDLEIDTGNNSDVVVLNEVEVDGEVDINTRGGDDAITAKNVEFGDETDVRTSGGNDVFIVYGQVNQFSFDVDIRTGGGADGVIFSHGFFSSEVDIRAGGGDDRVSLFDNTLNDEVEIRGGGRLDTYLFEGNNVLETPVELSSIEVEDDSSFGAEFVQLRNTNDALDDLVGVLILLNIT